MNWNCRVSVIVLALFLSLSSNSRVFADGSFIQKPLRKFILPSGVKLYFQRDTRSDLVQVSLALRLPQGGQYRPGAPQVLAHYLPMSNKKVRHMILPDSLPIQNHIGFVGAGYMVFWIEFLKQDADQVIPEFLQTYTEPVWEKAILERSKSRITDHFKVSIEDHFNRMKLLSRVAKDLYPDRNFNTDLSPDASQTNEVTMEDVKRLHEKMVHPLNLSFAVVGNIGLKKWMSLTKGSISKLQVKEHSSTKMEMSDLPLEKVEYLDIQESGASLTFAGPRVEEEQSFIFDLMPEILKVGFQGILEKKAKDYPGIFDLDVHTAILGDRAFLQISFRDENNQPKGFARELMSALQNFRESRISERELRKVRLRVQNMMLDSHSNPQKLTGLLAPMGLLNSPYTSTQRFTQVVDSLSTRDVQKMCKKYLLLDSYAYHSIEPLKNRVAGSTRMVDSKIHGVEMVVEEDPNQEVIGFALAHRLREAKNPVQTHLVAQALANAGFASYSKRVQERFEQMGLQCKSEARMEFVYRQCQMGAERFKQFVKLLPRMSLNPVMSREDFESAKREYIRKRGEVAQNQTEFEHFLKETIPSKPLSFIHLVDQDFLEEVNYKDSLEFMKENLKSSHLTIGFTGNVQSKPLQEQLEKGFANYFSEHPESKSLERVFSPRDAVLPKRDIINVTRDSNSDQFLLYLGRVIGTHQLSAKEMAALFVTTLSTIQYSYSEQSKNKKYEKLHLSMTFRAYESFSPLLLLVRGPKDELDLNLKMAEELMDEALGYVDSKGTVERITKLFMFSKNKEKMDRGSRAKAFVTNKSYGFSQDFEDRLLDEVNRLTPKEVKAIFQEWLSDRDRLLFK